MTDDGYEAETGFIFHPAASIFPMMSEEEIDNLAAEMRVEVMRALWVPSADAAKQLAYSNERKVLREAQEYLKANGLASSNDSAS